MNEPARILIVEDDWIVARAVQKILENAGFEVTGVVGSAAGALSSVHESLPDLILLDIVLGEGPDGIEVAKELRVLADVPIVFVTAHADATTLRRAAEVTPAGFVVKPFQEAQLLSTVTMAVTRASSDVTCGSEAPRPPLDDTSEPTDPRQHQLRQVAAAVSTRVPAPGRGITLTSRELEVVQLLLANGRVSSIAARLDISPHTVRNHLRSIFRKLGVHSQVELIRELSSHARSQMSVGAALGN